MMYNNEEVRLLTYRDVVRNRYYISESGRVYTTSGNPSRPWHELVHRLISGHHVVGLQVKDGRQLAFRVHRLVLAMWSYDSTDDVDHIDCNKDNNHYTNLEYVPEGENQRRAAMNKLYPSGENHFKAVLSEKQVRKICSMFEKGYNIRKIQRKLGLEDIYHIDNIMCHILHHETWKDVAKDYTWDIDEVRLKKYPKSMLVNLIRLALESDLTSRKVASYFPEYEQKKLINVVKKIRQRKLYKDIIDEVERSTTISDDYIRDNEGFIILAHKKSNV